MATVIAHSQDCPGGYCPTTYAHPEPVMSYVQGYRVTDPTILAPGRQASHLSCRTAFCR